MFELQSDGINMGACGKFILAIVEKQTILEYIETGYEYLTPAAAQHI